MAASNPGLSLPRLLPHASRPHTTHVLLQEGVQGDARLPRAQRRLDEQRCCLGGELGARAVHGVDAAHGELQAGLVAHGAQLAVDGLRARRVVRPRREVLRVLEHLPRRALIQEGGARARPAFPHRHARRQRQRAVQGGRREGHVGGGVGTHACCCGRGWGGGATRDEAAQKRARWGVQRRCSAQRRAQARGEQHGKG